MFDARIFIETLDQAKDVLKQHGAISKGEYEIHDSIYHSNNPSETLDKVFLRLRLVPKNIWDEKPYIVSIKNTELKHVGKQSVIPVKKQFNTEAEARAFLEDNYADTFSFSFAFNRTGEQYFMENDVVDLEVIEGRPSVEFKSKTEEGLKKLLQIFSVQTSQVIKGPSVVAMKEHLNV